MIRAFTCRLGRLGLWAAVILMSSQSFAQAPPNPPAMTVATIDALAQVGITPDAVVVANLQSDSANLLMYAAEAEELRALLHARQLALDVAIHGVALAEFALQTDPGNEDLFANLESARNAVSTAQTQVTDVREAFLLVVTNHLESQDAARLASWRSSLGVDVPAQFRVRERTAAEWKTLERALRAERRALRTQTPLHGEFASALQSVRAEPEVIAAASRLELALELVQGDFAEIHATETAQGP